MKSTRNRSVEHGAFTIERTYDAAPERVFAAFAQKEAKARWFGTEEGWAVTEWELDFREGGRERHVSHEQKGGPGFRLDVEYLDIVEGERIVYSYVMHIGDDKLSVSLTTLEFAKQGSRTQLKLTEHGAFFDGHDQVRKREAGTQALLDVLGKALSG